MVLQAAQHLTGISGKFPDAYTNTATVNEKTIKMCCVTLIPAHNSIHVPAHILLPNH